MVSKYGVLYLVPTPIGNLKDISLRALEILKEVEFIACEDTRVTNKLLSHYNIKKPLIIYYEHSDLKEDYKIIQLLLAGKNIALVSDAGTPLISDPGYKLILAVQDAGIEVIAIPGPCSVITALIVSGLPTTQFMFSGFLPNTHQAKLNKLNELKTIPFTMIFFETAKRLVDTLQNILAVFGNRKIAVIRELTKLYEEKKLDTVINLLNFYSENSVKGELILVIEGYIEEKPDLDQIKALMIELLKDNSTKEVVEEIHKNYNLPKKQIYDLALNALKSNL